MDAPVAFELSICNADKGTISEETLCHRVEQFREASADVVLTRTALFVEKAHILSDVRFVVGFDTAARLIDPKYYPGGGLETAMDAFRDRRVSFVVAGRVESPGTGTGNFLTLDNLVVPACARNLFVGIPEAQFRSDLSSTMIRKLQT